MKELTQLAQNNDLKMVCRVLLVFADNGTMTAEQAAEHLPDLTALQVSTAATQLAVKRKLNKIYANGKQTYPCVYEYNADLEPSTRAKHGRSMSPVAKAANSRARLPFVNAFRFRGKKVSLLERLIRSTTNPDERDLLLGILNDYSDAPVTLREILSR